MLAGILPRQRHESRMHLLEGSSNRPVGTARRQRVPPGPSAPGAARTLGFSCLPSMQWHLQPLLSARAPFSACLFRALPLRALFLTLLMEHPFLIGNHYQISLPTPFLFLLSIHSVLHSHFSPAFLSSHPQPSQVALCPAEQVGTQALELHTPRCGSWHPSYHGCDHKEVALLSGTQFPHL